MIEPGTATERPDAAADAAGFAGRVVEWTDRRSWGAFVDRARDGTIAHRWEWRSIFERVYGHRSFSLAAVDDGGELVGVLPLTLVTGRLFGRHLVSMPFLDYGGLCTDGRRDPETALVEAASAIAVAERARLELRHDTDRAIGLPRSLEKVTMLLDLEDSDAAQWKRLRSERRNRIKKAQRAGLEATFHGVEGVEDFYDVWSRNMRELGSPPHSRGFFRETLHGLGDEARIIVVRTEGTPIGAAVMLLHRDVVSIPWVSSLRSFFDRCPNQFLYWEAIRFAIERGSGVLDFGRSSRTAGTFEAKRQWGAEPAQLYWDHLPASEGALDGESPRLQLAARAWRRVPLPIADRIGPALRKGIPN